MTRNRLLFYAICGLAVAVMACGKEIPQTNLTTKEVSSSVQTSRQREIDISQVEQDRKRIFSIKGWCALTGEEPLTELTFSCNREHELFEEICLGRGVVSRELILGNCTDESLVYESRDKKVIVLHSGEKFSSVGEYSFGGNPQLDATVQFALRFPDRE
jgi:hypothetical protein